MTRPQTRIHEEHELERAAYLWSRGFKLRGVTDDPNRPRHKVFRFEDDGRIEQAVVEYLNGGTVPARNFANSISELKKLLYNGSATIAR